MSRRTLDDRFFSKVRMTDGCWIWIGAIGGPGARAGLGYGRIYVERKWVGAHRVAFEKMVGPIPAGLEIDHLCRNRQCVRPDHLEAVTRRVNTLRGETNPARNLAKSKCIHGHPFDDENTIICVLPDGRVHRKCRACRVKANRRTAARRRAERRHRRAAA